MSTANDTSSMSKAQVVSTRRFISLRVLAQMLDTTRSSARRWMREAGIHPVVIGRGRNGAIRYRWIDIDRWFASRKEVR